MWRAVRRCALRGADTLPFVLSAPLSAQTDGCSGCASLGACGECMCLCACRQHESLAHVRVRLRAHACTFVEWLAAPYKLLRKQLATLGGTPPLQFASTNIQRPMQLSPSPLPCPPLHILQRSVVPALVRWCAYTGGVACRSLHFPATIGLWPVYTRACVCVHEHWWSGLPLPALLCNDRPMARVHMRLRVCA